MVKRKQILLILAPAVLIAILGLFYYVYTSLDSIVKAAVERYGSEAVGTQVQVAVVEISLEQSRGMLRGIRVANPPGFSSEPAFVIDELTVQLETGSIGQSPLVLPEVRVSAPEVNLEITESGRSNLKVLADNLSGGPASSGPSRDRPEDSTKLAIREFVFEEGVVHARAKDYGIDQNIPLPALRIADLGGTEGASGKVIAQSIARALIEASMTAISRGGIEALIDRKLGGEAGEKAKDILRRILK